MLTYKTSMEMTEGGFCLGHGNQFGAFIADKIGGFFGDPEKDDTNNLQLPGFLNIFSDSTLNLTISMIVTFLVTWIIVVFIGNPTALATLNESAGEYNSFVYMIIQGFKFAGYKYVFIIVGSCFSGDFRKTYSWKCTSSGLYCIFWIFSDISYFVLCFVSGGRNFVYCILSDI